MNERDRFYNLNSLYIDESRCHLNINNQLKLAMKKLSIRKTFFGLRMASNKSTK